MGTKLVLAAAAFMLLCAGSAQAREEIKIEFNGSVYTLDKPVLALAQAPKAVALKTNNQQNMALRKMRLNPRPNTDDLLIGTLQKDLDIYAVVRELYEAGFKAQSLSDGHGYFYIAVDVAGVDAADRAIGLAKYYYVTEVFVGKKVYDAIFPPTQEIK